MAMPANKIQPNNESVLEFLSKIIPEQKRKDCMELWKMMESIVGEKAKLWRDMIGVGSYHYRYDSGREGDFFIIGFAPRAKKISIYATAYNEVLDQMKSDLGKVTLGKSCIYINRLADIDKKILKKVLKESLRINRERYPATN